MNLSDIFPFLSILLFYGFVAVIAASTPAFIIYRLYVFRMKKYQKATGLNPYRIPFNLRKLIFMAKKWGIEDDAKRQQMLQKASPQEKIELSKMLIGKEELIYRWLSTFSENILSSEANAYAWMMKSVEEMNLIIHESDQYKYAEQDEQSYSDSSAAIIQPASITKYGTTIRGRVRIIKLNSCVFLPFLIVSFVIYFVLFGKLWSILIPNDPNSIGLIVVNCLSGAASLFTWGFIVGVSKLIRIPGVEVKI